MKTTFFSKISPAKIIDWAASPPSKPSPVRKAIRTIGRIVILTIQEFQKNELSLRSAALTYTVMLSLVPILAMSTAVVKGLGGGDQLREVVYSYVGTLERAPDPPEVANVEDTREGQGEEDSSLTQHLYSALDKLFDYVDRTNFTTLGTIGMAGLILSVVLVLGNIEMAMNAIWNVESGRSVMRKISDYLALLVLMPISVNVGLAANTVLMNEDLLAKFSILLPIGWIQALTLKLLPVFFLALTLYIIYLFFPNTKVKSIPAVTGALFAGFCWFEVQNIYISLQIGVARYNAIYGSFATLPLFLVWIYFGWIFILLGAQIAYVCQNRNILRLTKTPASPSAQLAVAFDILDYVHRCFEQEKQATIPDFCSKFPMHDLHLVQDTLDILIGHYLLHLAADGHSINPSIPVQKIENTKIIYAIFGTNCSDTEGGRKSASLIKAAATSLPPLADRGDSDDKEQAS